MRLVLCHTVQIEPRFDLVLTAFQPNRISAIDAAEAIERDRMRRRVYRWNCAWDKRYFLREPFLARRWLRRERPDIACCSLP